MSALELVRTAVLNVLQAADIPAAAAYSDDWAAAYETPVLTVGVGGGGSLRVGFHDYLGEWYDEKTASYQERYGKELDVSLLLDAYAPRAVGAAGCDTLLDQVQNVLTASPPAGLRMGTWSGERWTLTGKRICSAGGPPSIAAPPSWQPFRRRRDCCWISN